MDNSQSLQLSQKIGIRLSQQQLRFVKLLELNAPELDEAVDRELEDNPALGVKEEVADEDRARYPVISQRSAPDDYQFSPVDNSSSLYDDLLIQLAEKHLNPDVETAAKFIIGSLDPNGYLTTPLNLLVDDMAFGPGFDISIADAEHALDVVRHLDPPGIGASDLQDCLRLQLEALRPSAVRNNALRIINEAYDAFVKKHKQRISSMLRLSDAQVDEALSLILSLNPKPGAALGNNPSDSANVIIPDFVVDNEDGNLTITLNNKIPELRIEQSFEQAMQNLERTAKGRPKKGSEFIVSRYNDARDFIRILTQRQQTMMTVMTAIVNIQREYFLTEDVYNLKPMMIKNVADITGLDLSVISRATTNKFVATNWGIFPLRFFFSDTIGEEKEGTDAATNRKIEAQIKKLIDNEDKQKPLSDRRITELMNKEGYDLSRRTVAKYRDRIGIPVARLRKNL